MLRHDHPFWEPYAGIHGDHASILASLALRNHGFSATTIPTDDRSHIAIRLCGYIRERRVLESTGSRATCYTELGPARFYAAYASVVPLGKGCGQDVGVSWRRLMTSANMYKTIIGKETTDLCVICRANLGPAKVYAACCVCECGVIKLKQGILGVRCRDEKSFDNFDNMYSIADEDEAKMDVEILSLKLNIVIVV
jgi:hypothetical protein